MDAQTSIVPPPFGLEADIAQIRRLSESNGAHAALIEISRYLRSKGHGQAATDLLCDADRILDRVREHAQ